MDDNVFENSVLLTRYLTLNFFPFLCYSALDSNGCRTLRFVVSDAIYFSFLKGRRLRDESCVLNYSSTFEAEIIRVFRIFFLESSF